MLFSYLEGNPQVFSLPLVNSDQNCFESWLNFSLILRHGLSQFFNICFLNHEVFLLWLLEQKQFKAHVKIRHCFLIIILNRIPGLGQFFHKHVLISILMNLQRRTFYTSLDYLYTELLCLCCPVDCSHLVFPGLPTLSTQYRRSVYLHLGSPFCTMTQKLTATVSWSTLRDLLLRVTFLHYCRKIISQIICQPASYCSDKVSKINKRSKGLFWLMVLGGQRHLSLLF